MKIEVLHPKSLKTICEIDLSESKTVGDIKNAVEGKKKSLYPDRQMIKADPIGKSLNDDELIGELVKKYPTNGGNFKVYLKDLGPQVGWATVFLTEYAGPLFIYLIFYFRPSFIYSSWSAKGLAKYEQVQHLACFCWTFHYAKRLLETIFVHRFSHATMPILNIFKNSAYYWGFTALVAYFVNHPLYTKASFGDAQIYLGFALFLINEFGNYSIHVALRDLRPPGTKQRNIPKPTSNPFTTLFRYVSCPNYTYEIYSWISFTIMTQTLTAGLFAFVGAAQMIVWALGKHRNYRKEFKEYPRGRKAIIPFLI